ncbi:MAG: UDP-3-O-acyl-N-acetylglucosamine deacetylase [Deltaproteobacteria bacterium]|nr:UDP-3-O-acyl-N-acetylglucosamine deacetylase [Deltaproteobacteria bacterium]
MSLQRTIKKEITCHSIGLHSGKKVGMIIKPANTDEGIIFVRRNENGGSRIKAHIGNVSDTTLATTIGNNGTSVSTIEHLMSAFRGMGVDNAIVELDAAEVPIMDGSALPFVKLLNEAGIKIQKKFRKWLVVKKPVTVTDGEGTVSIIPSPDFQITYKIDFDHPLIGEQSYHMFFSKDIYEQDICIARTFGFLKDVEYLQAKGLALGGSLQNAIVLNEEKIINKEGLRCPDEFVKHKVLDAIGDLSLIGMPILGHLIAYKSGHKLHNSLLQELLSHKDNWEIVRRYKNKRPVEGQSPFFHAPSPISAPLNA